MKKKILIVDDQGIFREQLASSLQESSLSEFVEIFQAESGATGIELFKKYQFDFMFVDFYMPEMDGLLFLNNLMSENNKKYKHIKKFIITTEASKKLKEKASKLGVESWIVKPIQITKFLSSFEKKYF
jgi:two-component system, chemotaxis family, chemotaxis protein CheY